MSNGGKALAGVGSSLAALAAWYFLWTNRRIFYVNDITTGENSAYPEMRSRVYYADVPEAMRAAEQALRQLPGWNVASVDLENDALDAEAKVGGPFVSDVTVYVISIGHGQTRVTIRSRSRTAGGDLGRNAACIRQLQMAMDGRLNTDAAF